MYILEQTLSTHWPKRETEEQRTWVITSMSVMQMGILLTDRGEIKDRWQEYVEELFNVTNTRKEPEKCDLTEGPIPRITAEEIRKQLDKLKNRKANWPDNLPIELWKVVGEAGIESLETTMDEVMRHTFILAVQ